MDDIKRIDLVDIELTGGEIHRSWLKRSIGTADAMANAFGVRVFRDGETVNLEGGSVQGFFRDPHGNNIALTMNGTISGNEAYVTLPAACYNYEGQFTLAIKVKNTSAGITGTMRIVDGMVDNTHTDSPVGPTESVPDYDDILAVYDEMLEAKEGSVRFDITQTLTSAQKTKARGNVDAAWIAQVVRVDDDQSLTSTQKEQARENIEAASTEGLEGEGEQREQEDIRLQGLMAETFDETKNYPAGKYLFYAQNRNLYQLTAPYTANSGWSAASKVQITRLSDGLAGTEWVARSDAFNRGNLYDCSKAVDGKYIDNSGTEQTSSSLFHTDYIPVKAGETYYISIPKQSSPGGFYDTGKAYAGKAVTVDYGSVCTYTASRSGYIILNAGNARKTDLIVCAMDDEGRPYYQAIGNDAVIENRQMIRALVAPANLYDKNAPVTEDSVLLNDGTISELEGNVVTGYIGIPGGGEYAVSYTMSTPGCAYDADKNLISKVYTAGMTSAAKTVFTLPEAAKYVRLNIPDGQRDGFVLAKGGNVNVNSYGQNAMPGLFMEQNLYTQEGVTAGALLLNDGTIDDSSDFAVSDYIELPGTGVYTVPYAFSSPGCLYDISKTYIGRAYTAQSSNTPYSFEVTNANARYIRLNLKIADVGSFVFCRGYGLTEVPHGTKMIYGLKVFARDIVGTVASRWAGKTIVCFGDSRTWYDGKQYGSATKAEWEGQTCVGYQQALAELMGANIVSQGVSGETSTQICTRVLAYNFSACDAVLLEGGVNDYVKSSQVTIGEIAPIGSTFDTTTVYGAWQSAVEYIQTNYPQVKIFMDVPAIAWTSGGVFPYNTAKIKAEIAELYSLPCVDLYKEAGITVCNYDYYYVDDVDETGWHLHFNDYGNRLVGEILAGFMNTH